jgi:hypothetical protein
MRYFCWLLCIISFHPLVGQNATSIVREADQKMRGNTMQTEMVIKTIRSSWSREMECKTWSKGNQLAMIYISLPAKDKGITFLKRKKEVWNWMPVLEKVIKLPPSMMNQSWMGTDFTNDDLVKESSVVEDYVHSIIGDTVIDNRNCYIIQLIPKPEAAVVWSKIIVCIDKKDLLELHSRFYEEDNKLVSTMNAYDIRMMDDRLVPTRLEMIPAEKKGQKTIMIYRKILYNKPIDERFFTVEKMKNVN